MQFDKSYWYDISKSQAQQYKLNPGSLGLTAPPFEKQLNQLKAKIFEGVSNVELGFMGRGKGSIKGGNITPGMHGKIEREDMRQLAKANEVKLTTHASANAMGMAGFTQQGFSDEAKESNLHEVERAIDFAADVAEGGPVVVHTGEFPRPISEAEKEKPGLFKAYPEEEEKKVHRLVNERTGQIFTAAREDEWLFIPKPRTDEHGNPIQRLTADGELMTIRNPITGEDEPVFVAETDDEGRIQINKKDYKTFKEEKLAEGKYKKEEIPKLFFWEHMKTEIEQAMGTADEYEVHAREAYNAQQKLRGLLKQYKELESKASKEGLERLKQRVLEDVGRYLPHMRYEEIVPTEAKLPSDVLKDAIWRANKFLSYGQEVSSGSRRRVEQMLQQLRETKGIEEYAVDRSAKTLARAGIFAYDQEKKKKLKEPLFVSMENIFPEQYGAHPDELRELVHKSRKEMIELLKKKKGMSEGAARKVAEDHIKITFDIGHAYTWKKYFEGSDEDFRRWLAGKISKLAKEGIIGHVHLSDNFGWEDEHVAPGEGTAPIGMFIKELKKHGYKGKMIIEPGAQDRAIDAMRLAMRHFHSPVYRIDGASVDWSEIEHGYFGKTRGPTYIVGAYAPDVDLPTEHRQWTFWSGVPME